MSLLTWMLPSDKAMQSFGEAEETVLLQAKEQWRGGRLGRGGGGATICHKRLPLIHVIDMEKLPSSFCRPHTMARLSRLMRRARLVVGGLRIPQPL